MRWQEEGGRLTGKSSQKHNEKQKGKAKPTTATRHVGAWGPPRWGSGHVQAVRSPGGQSRQHEGGEPGRGGVATSSQGEGAEPAQGTRQREGGSPRGGRTPWRESQVAQSRAFTDQERETARRSRKWPRAREMKHDSVVSSKERKIVRRRLEVVTCLSKARGPSVDPIQRPWRWEARHSEEQQAVFFG